MHKGADRSAIAELHLDVLKRRRVARFDDIFESEAEEGEHIAVRDDQRKRER